MIFIILSIIFIYLTALVDANHLNNHQYFKEHDDRLLQRISVGLLITYFNPLYGLVLALMFWAFFDSTLSYLRGLPLLYIGTESETDKYFKSEFNLYVGSKIIAFIVSLIIIIL